MSSVVPSVVPLKQKYMGNMMFCELIFMVAAFMRLADIFYFLCFFFVFFCIFFCQDLFFSTGNRLTYKFSALHYSIEYFWLFAFAFVCLRSVILEFRDMTCSVILASVKLFTKQSQTAFFCRRV